MIEYKLIINFIEVNLRYILLSISVLSLLIVSNILARRKKLFYNTGFKLIFSAWDKLKFKLRLADFDDTKGIRYIYLFEVKIFGFDFYRLKYIDQKGKIYKRNLRFGGK
jgi:hypothetical protein